MKSVLELLRRIIWRKSSGVLLLIIAFALVAMFLFDLRPYVVAGIVLICLVGGISWAFARTAWDCTIGYNADAYSGKRSAGSYWVDFGESLSGEGFKQFVFDRAGIPRFRVRSGLVYFPTFVGWWALHMVNMYGRTGDRKFKESFLAQAEWFRKNAKRKSVQNKDCVLWFFDFDWKEGEAKLKKPWVSALGQGVAASTLIRAYSMTGKRVYRDLAEAALNVFEIDAEDGGVRVREGSVVYYEEYPAVPYAHVLDGFVFGLLGIYDVWRVTRDRRQRRLFAQGVKVLSSEKGFLKANRWDFFHMWSMYGSHGILCDHFYNKLNSVQMRALADMTGSGRLRRIADYWDPGRKGIFRRFFIWVSGRILILLYSVRMVVKGGNF